MMAQADRDGVVGRALHRCLDGQLLSRRDMRELIGGIVDEAPNPVHVGALLAALAARGESPEEIAGAAEALLERAHSVPAVGGELLDVCGTGGDGSRSFNVSTCVAFVVAGTGVKVAKHGNRGVSSGCGSADVLEALGVRLDLPPEHSAHLLAVHGIAFLFAPHYHPAMRAVAQLRRELGVRTLFNLAGPLSNPARPARQVIGVSQARVMTAVAKAAVALGCKRVAVVHAADGMDEVSLSGPTRVLECDATGCRAYTIQPSDAGLESAPATAVRGGSPAQNAQMLEEILDGRQGPRTDIVVLNAALALTVAGAADGLREGLALARHSIESGAARAALRALQEAQA
jgi:anthranilate phosphoribosyltransferase